MRTLVWRGQIPDGVGIEVTRDPVGVWTVVIGGFSRSRSESLAQAVEAASGGTLDRRNVRQIVELVERSSG